MWATRMSFRFNDPQGMCPECNGLGRKMGVGSGQIPRYVQVAQRRRDPGAEYAVNSWRSLPGSSGFFDNDKKLADYTKTKWNCCCTAKTANSRQIWRQYGQSDVSRALSRSLHEVYSAATLRHAPSAPKKRWRRTLTMGPCPLCKGARLSQAALSCKINGYNIADLSAMEVSELIDVPQG